jgi:iron complex outermembrane recepter protein
MKNFTAIAVLLSGASLTVLSAPAFAQGAKPEAANEEAAIVVTGSRVIKNGDASPSPVTVISTEDLTRANPGATLAESLNFLPVFAGSRGSGSNPTTVGSAAGGNGSANQLNLRNLGAVRNLVLMDGKRVPPSLFNGVVDVDVIPQMLVERVDIVTGGVSAVYGSDAMSGVVNYVINHKFNGLRAETSYGISQLGDATKFDAAVAYGTNLTDRLHVELSYEYHKEGGIDRRSNRSWLNQVGVTGAGTTASPYVLQTDLRQKGFPFGGLINTGALAGQVFKQNGVLSPFINGTATGTAAIQVGGDGGYWDSGLLSRLNGHQLFGRLDYDLSDDIRAYVQVSGNLKTNTNFAETNQLNAVAIRRTNGFLPTTVSSLIPTGQATFTFSKFMGDVDRVQADADSRQWIYTAGLEGRSGGLNWGFDYTHGVSNLKTALSNVLNRQKLSAALDAVTPVGGGAPVCNITITNPGLMNDCVALNVFGPNASSAAAIDYVTDNVFFTAKTVMDDVAVQVSGSPFATWAGEVNLAASGEWRKMSFSSTSTSRPTDLVNCTGLTLNCTVGNPLTEFVFGERPGGVSQTVWEVGGEIDVPLLKDALIARSVNFNGAIRFAKYNTSGASTTWKAGFDWRVADSLRFRLTRSRDFRAPTLYDLFSPTSIVQIRPLDSLTGLTPTVPSIDQSNANLKAEIGNTLTVGAVWKPTSRLSFAVDGYRIKISNAITQINGSTANFQTACYASGGTSPYCALQARPLGFTNTTAANAVTAWYTQNINISQVETWGIDFEANLRTSILNRPASIRVLAAWQPHVYYRQPDVTTVDQGGVAFGPLGLASTPSVRITAFARFQPFENFTVDIMERWRNPMKLGGDPTQVWVNNRIGAFATTNINLAWDVEGGRGEMQFYVNVQNLFNAIPPVGGFSGNGTRAGLRDGYSLGDDVRGRYFTAGVKLKF